MSGYDSARKDYYRLRCEKVARELERRDFEAIVVKDTEEAASRILDLIDVGDTVGIPGSVSVRELRLVEALSERGNAVVEHWVSGKSREELRSLRLAELNSDVLLTGTNAITLDGKLVNIDGTGNRVASMVYGPDKVVVIAGANKIADDLDEALKRSRRVAAPINALRLNLDTPCAETGYCVDCESPKTICAVTVVMEKRPSETEVIVVLVPEDLGY
ncbi:MAG: lactate utilization protein [Clostridia bacterium]